MAGLIAHYGLLIVVLIIFTGELGIPTLVPGEIAILIAGVQVVHTVPQLIGVWLLFGLVDILACSTIHLVCRTCGNRVLLRLLRRLQPNRCRHEEVIESWRRRLGGHDPLVVFVTRLIPMFRLYASITSGLIRLRFRHFVSGAIPASLLWAAIPLTAGFLLRSKAPAIEGQFPLIINIVIGVTTTILVGGAVTAWIRSAGSRPASLRRLRLVLGLGAAGGAVARMILVEMNVDRVFNAHFFIPSAQAISIWVSFLSVVALALLWVAAHDIRAIRAHHHGRHLGAYSLMAWGSLMLMFVALNSVPVLSPAGL